MRNIPVVVETKHGRLYGLALAFMMIVTVGHTGCLYSDKGDDEVQDSRHYLAPNETVTIGNYFPSEIVDLNNDGLLDLVYSFTTSNMIDWEGWKLGLALSRHKHFDNGSFFLLEKSWKGRGFTHFELVDMNNDGWLDVVTFHIYGNLTPVHVFYFDSGGFSEKADQIFWTKTFRDLIPVDFNGDGNKDLFCGGHHGEFFVHLQNPNGSFSNESSHNYEQDSEMSAFLVGYLNNDEHPDIVYFEHSYRMWNRAGRPDNEQQTRFMVYYYNATSESYQEECFVLNNRIHYFHMPRLLDFDGDGSLDVYLSYGHREHEPNGQPSLPRESMVFLNENGSLNRTPVQFEYITVSAYHDLAGDGTLELFRGTGRDPQLIFLDRNGSIERSVRFGKNAIGHGDYGVPFIFDYDGDGVEDILIRFSTRNEKGQLEYWLDICLMEPDLDENGYPDNFDRYWEEEAVARAKEEADS